MIKAIITDFDGTLVDTFEANFRAYQDAFFHEGIMLTRERYRECFGYRFDGLMTAMCVNDNQIAERIRERKKICYPKYFSYLVVNEALLELIMTFHSMGGKSAIASTARKENLMNVINYLQIGDNFDLIYSGANVKEGKPNPEIYFKSMTTLGVTVEETLIFEDSEVGLEAAHRSGAKYIRIIF